ncbi:MAG TPA: alpha-glucosidase/alpha-galactosidase [Gaiellaceae bacterium]|jgi:alpha-galactosidase|nr:alpha-glucosidase/alpha-galactosidase [Gaiellaceae bacterium]
MTRIAFIGAGSVVFTKNLLGDILDFPELRDVEIALHDIDADRLATAEAMARYVAGEREAAPRITAHADRRAALDGSDYVINMVQIGGHEATLRDFEIPARYGLRQTIADTIGIGGIFRTLRTADHMLALGREMADLCPGAWLLNYSNPMAMLCWLVYAGTPTSKVVGLCHSVQFTVEDLAALVGVSPEDVTFLAAGLNHQAFILRFERDGEDLYPRLDERIAADPDLQRRVRVALYRRLGFFPTESSEHAAEYVPWFMRHDDQIERFRIPVDEYIRRSEDNLVEYERVKDAIARGEAMPLERSNEYASLIIHSIETGEPRVIYGNVRNAGLLPGLPEGCCVEVPCLIDRTGVRPTPVPEYPGHLAALNRTFVNVVELTVRAVLEGRPDYVRHAAMLDPNASATLTLDEIDELCDELTRAHGALIPAELRAAQVEELVAGRRETP